MEAVDHPEEQRKLTFRIRMLIAGFMIGLALSGITAFPLTQELRMLTGWLGVPADALPGNYSGLTQWIVIVRNALIATERTYPFLFYGYDWLAFAHLVIAMLFVGPFRDPVRNIWVIRWGMLACVATWPLAFICGSLRGIPLGWQIIDCSFGFVGLVPLFLCHRWIKRLESESGTSP